MALALAELDDLVLDRRAVARSDAFDAAAVHRRAFQVVADHLVRSGVRVGDPAGNLRQRRLGGLVGERARRVVAGLDLQRVIVDGAAIDSRRGARLEPADLEAELHQPLGGPFRRGLAGAAGAVGVVADVDLAAQEGAGCQDDAATAVTHAAFGDDPGGATGFHHQLLHRPLADVEIGLALAGVFHLELIRLFVALGSRGPYGGALAGVQASELDAGAVGVDGHLAAERIDLLDQVPLADAADRRVAGHLADGIQVHRQQQGARAHAGGGEGGLGTGVTAADDDDVMHGCRVPVPAPVSKPP